MSEANKLETLTFAELVQYGKDNGANIVRGMPWSFVYKGHPVSHENDKRYLICLPDTSSLNFFEGDLLVSIGTSIAVISGGEKSGKPVEKRAPVQGYTPGIPWSLHLEAYDAYRKRYGAQEALIDLEGRGCRGGFGVQELDVFIPGWRDRVSRLTHLEQANAALRARVAELEKADQERQKQGVVKVGSVQFTYIGDIWRLDNNKGDVGIENLMYGINDQIAASFSINISGVFKTGNIPPEIK